jgi:hypothetical protein
VIPVAASARQTFEGMPGLRSKVFTVDDAGRRAMNFYVWESAGAAKSFFSEEMRERVTGLYGVEPTVDFVETAQLVDNSGTSHQKMTAAPGPTRRNLRRQQLARLASPGDPRALDQCPAGCLGSLLRDAAMQMTAQFDAQTANVAVSAAP